MTTQKVADPTAQKVSDLTVSELLELIREVVMECLAEMYEDFHPDLEFTPEFAAELLQAAKEAREAGQLTIPDDQIAELEKVVKEHSQG